MRRAVLLVPLAIIAASSADAAQQIAKHQDWTLFKHEAQSGMTCFAAAQPAEMLPKGANRDSAYFYVSAWPKDGVKSEVSVKLGYPIKSGSPVTVKIGNDSFKLFANEERGFVSDPTEELKLVEAMKKGSSMQVIATSQRGTSTTDSYSLSGITSALQDMADKCN